VTCGAFTETGEFILLPVFGDDAMLHAWEEALYKTEKPDCRAFPLLAGDGMRPGPCATMR
jgi:hypothetical protein